MDFEIKLFDYAELWDAVGPIIITAIAIIILSLILAIIISKIKSKEITSFIPYLIGISTIVIIYFVAKFW